jgi:predicted DNA-binding transcriptional regulator AlpA
MNPKRQIANGTPHDSVPMKPEDILTPDQLAQRLQVKRSWVYEKCRRRGKYAELPLPVLRIGRYLRFYWPDICDWMRTASENPRGASRRR